MIKNLSLSAVTILLFAACQAPAPDSTPAPTPTTMQTPDREMDAAEMDDAMDEEDEMEDGMDEEDEMDDDMEAYEEDEMNDEEIDDTDEINDDDDTVSEDDMSDEATTDGFSQTAAPQPGDTVATVTTNLGTFKVRLFADVVPTTVENFVTLSNNGYYEGIIFHRIIDGFMIQGGDPTGTGTGGESAFGGKFDDEFSSSLSNIKYSLSMANAGPNTNGSQFFVNQADNTFLDFDKQPLSSKHSVFGQVYEGQEVVDTIASVQTGPGDKPLENVIIESVEISTM